MHEGVILDTFWQGDLESACLIEARQSLSLQVKKGYELVSFDCKYLGYL